MTKRTHVACFFAATASLFVLGIGDAYAKVEKKVTLCHVPPGNPANAHTITVGESAASAHLAHGDEVGECPTGCRSNAACDDGNPCTSDSCATSGDCFHAPVSCDDGNPCTGNFCDQAKGCVSVADDDASCDDGNECTSADRCAGGTCHGSPIAGCCRTSADCDDGAACTVDGCVAGSCTNQPRDCAVADKCLAGFCDSSGACDVAPVSCDDSNFCTDDSCDAAAGCIHTATTTPPESSEVSCADGLDNDCDGAVDSADSDCGYCGDGVVQADHPYCLVSNCPSCVHNPPCSTGEVLVSGEECDDGNTITTDGCDECILTNPTPD